MSVYGVPMKKLSPERRKVLALVPVELRSELLRKWRQADWARKSRAANPALHLERARANRKRLVAIGYYRKGGKGYSPTPTSEKRRAYWREYNRIRRAK
jgi:hypothetical protein